MTYKIQILPSALKELSKLDKTTKKRIDTHILDLANIPRPSGAIAMKGESKGLFRIVVGKYRVIYEIKDDQLVIVVVKVGLRREVYR